MHRQDGARRWARLLGAAVLGGALSVGAVAALPAEAAPRLSSGIDLSNLTEEGSYGGLGGAGEGTANSVGNGDLANSVGNGDRANSVENGDRANSVSSDLANSVRNKSANSV